MFDLCRQLSASASVALQRAYGVSVEVPFDIPAEEGRGDLTTAVPVQLARKLNVLPQSIADVLRVEIERVSGVTVVDVAGAGYVNVSLAPSVLLGGLQAVLAECRPRPQRDEESVIVEYSQPNIAKPLGIHHILSTIIGQAIANLYAHAGHKVIRWNYIGDWGTQFGKLAVAYRRWGEKPIDRYSLDELLALYVRFHQEAEHSPSLEDEGREAFRMLERGDPTLRAFWRAVLDINKQSLSLLYQRLRVSFDLDLGESFYEEKLSAILDEGKAKGVFVEGEGGARIVRFPEASKLPPYMVCKSDGATLYSTRDIAQMRYRIDMFHPREILIVTDAAQKLHFQQLVATCQQLGWALPAFENVLLGRMRFADRQMSTRKGNILKLENVLDEAVRRADLLIAEKASTVSGREREELREMIGVGSVVYGVLSQNRRMDIVFDWGKFLTFEGNSAPYLQYTHARARSVLRRAAVDAPLLPKNYPSALPGRERHLLRLLLTFPHVLHAALADRFPHRLSQYLYGLCQAYNAFYTVDPILKAGEPERSLRLAVTSVTAAVLRCGAEILTLRVPDRM